MIAEALSRRLKRPLSSEEAGFGKDHRSWWSRSLPVQLNELAAAAGSNRRAFRRVCVYQATALDVPTWLDAQGARSASAAVSSEAGGNEPGLELQLATDMLRFFARMDQSYGAGFMRPAASAFLAYLIGPWLDLSTTAAAPRAELMSLCSQLAHLCGFMSFDDESHGPAQRFYRTSLVMAADLDRPDEYAWTLRAMSAQAHHLGHFGAALRLAETAAAPDLAVLTKASLAGQTAVARAATGARRQAMRDLERAEDLLGRAPAQSTRPVGTYHGAVLSYEKAAVHAHLRDHRAALAALEEALPRWSAYERRSRAITLARLAELQLRQGRPEEAISVGHRLLDDYALIRSTRIRKALADLRAGLRPFSKNRAVNAFLRRAGQSIISRPSPTRNL
ncbi:tetratricopeptide repeat protein [Actinomadura sp. KC06]|uniref:tetratricopeptide repeat protein n=1 Tax=Actinomadura sp. KC06 TaxID=2530369 RepID=UPI001045D7F7|nr:tetratricopeptide repeat protein [Actinomadura sp. KC06]TDD29606.1 tetratricopeptide repeat protein [Actinomadura sp. KC06]